MLSDLLLIVYCVTFFLCFGSYFLYPLVVFALGRIAGISVQRAEITPPVSIIISAYNEGKDIRKKLSNTLAQDYPSEKVEILIGSDGSTDDTAAEVKAYPASGIRFFDFQENRGKTSVQNDLVAKASHDILIFTDAASFLPKDALKKMVRNFADERVGCVAGKMRFVDTDKNITTQSQGIYWRYEVKVRELESALGSLIGVDGPLYAVKRPCYVPLAPNIISDLMTPLLVLGQGKMAVLESEAFVDEEPKEKSGQEFNTRRRITLRGMVGVFSHATLLNPLRHPLLALQILFHKVIRWGVGLLVFINLLACLGLAAGSTFFQYILVSYGIFFCAAILGWLAAGRDIKVRALSIPYYFCLVNLAASLGLIDFLRGKQAITWKTLR